MNKRWKVVAIVATALVIVLAVTGVVLAQSPWSDSSSPVAAGQGQGAGQGNLASKTAAAPAPATVSAVVPATSGTHATIIAAATGDLTQAEADSLLFLREEEKLARDVYLVLFDETGKKTFSNIAASEQRHMDSVKTLLDAYGLADPVGADTPGVFSNPDLQKAYDTLVAQGSQSLAEALKVGVAIENLDIEDLQALLAIDPSADITQVAQSLLKGSENHLASFTRLLAA
jgi:hypothetical protein